MKVLSLVLISFGLCILSLSIVSHFKTEPVYNHALDVTHYKITECSQPCLEGGQAKYLIGYPNNTSTKQDEKHYRIHKASLDESAGEVIEIEKALIESSHSNDGLRFLYLREPSIKTIKDPKKVQSMFHLEIIYDSMIQRTFHRVVESARHHGLLLALLLGPSLLVCTLLLPKVVASGVAIKMIKKDSERIKSYVIESPTRAILNSALNGYYKERSINITSPTQVSLATIVVVLLLVYLITNSQAINIDVQVSKIGLSLVAAMLVALRTILYKAGTEQKVRTAAVLITVLAPVFYFTSVPFLILLVGNFIALQTFIAIAYLAIQVPQSNPSK